MSKDLEHTARGFALSTFKDMYGSGCSLQKSSLATEDAIWLGIDDAEPKILASQTPEGGTGWVPFNIPDGVSLTTRMHLNKDQAWELSRALRVFAVTGDIPPVDFDRESTPPPDSEATG